MLALILSACSSTSSTPSTPNVNQQTGTGATYTVATSAAVPGLQASLGNPAGTIPTSGGFDISFVADGNYYLADRDTNGIDVINLSTRKFTMLAGAGQFKGVNLANGNAAGPNGIFSVGTNLEMAGDGNSTMKVINTSTGAVVNTNSANTIVTNTTPQVNAPVGWKCSGAIGGTPGGVYQRADEGAWDSTDNIAMLVNDADCPPFATFYNTAVSTYPQVAQISFVGANNGAEQPSWDPTQDLFLIAIPTTVTNPGGEIDVINPKAPTAIASVFPEPANCQANGTAIGPNEELFLGCSNQSTTQSLVILNATNGATVATIPGAGGCDEVWFNKGDNRFYAACSNNKVGGAGPIIAVVNAASPFNLIATIPTNTGAHSVAADATTNTLWVPMPGTNGINVYTHN
jgi:hypothetical protein